MRFHQLPVGARFHYKGECYRKINGLTASPEQGGKAVVIPRSATVQPAGATEAVAPAQPGAEQQLAGELLLQLHQHCQQCLSQLAGQIDIGPLAEELQQHYLTLRAQAMSD